VEKSLVSFRVAKMTYRSYKGPTQTPWGVADHREELIPGIVFVGTPSHGGYWISAQRKKEMPEVLRTKSGWYEEDCDWALVYLAFADDIERIKPDIYAKRYQAAVETVKSWNPEAYEAFFNTVIPPGESYIKDKETFLRDNEGKLAVFAAVGVDNGMVKVCAGAIDPKSRDFRRIDTQSKLEFLVPKADYDQRGQFGFIIDPSKYEKVEA
jgi:hypothetical protein